MHRILTVILILAAAKGVITQGGQASQSLPPPNPPRLSQAEQPTAPRFRKVAPLPLPCSQRLKSQTDLNAELTSRIEVLEKENASLRGLANELAVERQETVKKTGEILKK